MADWGTEYGKSFGNKGKTGLQKMNDRIAAEKNAARTEIENKKKKNRAKFERICSIFGLEPKDGSVYLSKEQFFKLAKVGDSFLESEGETHTFKFSLCPYTVELRLLYYWEWDDRRRGKQFSNKGLNYAG